MRNETCRCYTRSNDNRLLLKVMEFLMECRIPFYFSGRGRTIRAQSRNVKKINRLEIEIKALGLTLHKKYYY